MSFLLSFRLFLVTSIVGFWFLTGILQSASAEQTQLQLEGSHQRMQEQLSRAYSLAVTNASVQMGISVPPPARAIFCETDACFEQFSLSPYLVGLASWRDNFIAVHLGRLGFDESRVSSTLTHELIHIGIGHLEKLSTSKVPRWLNEGIAQLLSGSVAEVLSEESSTLTFYLAVLNNSLLPFGSLAHFFPAQQPALSLAYEQSRRFLLFLDEEYGHAATLRLLKEMEKGSSFERAFEQSFGTYPEDLMDRWRKQISLPLAVVSALGGMLPTLLLGMGAVLLAVGLVFARNRQRRAMQALDDDSAAFLARYLRRIQHRRRQMRRLFRSRN